MANIVKALVLVVQIAAAWVQVPIVAPTKMHVGKACCPEGAPMIQNRTSVEDHLTKAELHLDENI